MRVKHQLSIIKGKQTKITPCCLHRLFEKNLNQHPCKPALIYDNEKTSQKLTYQEVNERSNQYGRVILQEAYELALKPNQDGDYIVAICMEPSENLIMVLLAIWKAGAAYLPIDPSFPAVRKSHIINEARPIMVICDNEIDGNAFVSTCTLTLNDLNKKVVSTNISNIPDGQMLTELNDLAIVLYTSGSTGVPKGVRLTHAAIFNRLKWQWETFPYMADESIGVFKTTLTFLDSVSEIWSPLQNGLAVLIVPKATTKDPEMLVNLLEEYKIHRLVLVPTLLTNILMYLKMNGKSNEKRLSNLRNWVCSGEALPKQLVEQFFDYFEEGTYFLHNFYGSTEIMADVTYFTCQSKKQISRFETVPMGIPIFNNVIYLLDDDYRPVKNGEIGEIFVAGLNLAQGYVNGRDPDRFFQNPFAVEEKYSRLYCTGDYGCFQNGFIMYKGRTDSQVKIRGYRVDLTEVEKVIMSLNGIEKAVVLCHHADQIDRSIVAFSKLNDSSTNLTSLTIEADLKNKLAEYMRPQVVIIDHYPLLTNGKVDRQSLLKSFEKRNDKEMKAFDISQCPEDLKVIAADLFNTVASVIGCSTRGTLTMDSNFYEMGGNSLNSITTISLLREKGYHIEISDFVSAKSFREVMTKMGNKKSRAPVNGGISVKSLNMKAFPLTAADKDDCVEILADGFYEKGDTEHWVRDQITRQEYIEIMENNWRFAIKNSYSFLVKDINTNKTIGTVFNYDVEDEPDFDIISSVAASNFDIVEVAEAPIREKLFAKGIRKIMYSCLMGTSLHLNPQENIACIQFMEEETMKLAKGMNFEGVLTANASPLTQQLAIDVNGYTCLNDYQINRYIHKDGTKPFGLAPDSVRLMVCYKEV